MARLRYSSRVFWVCALVGVLALGGLLAYVQRGTEPTKPSRAKAYVAFFLGQGSYLLSWGIPYLAWQARKLGMETDVFEYSELREAWTSITRKKREGYKIALVGYSLGNSTATYLQREIKVDLLLAIAQSSLGRNHRINKSNTVRSVLWHGPDFLSNAGLENGFDEIKYINTFHLWMNVDPRVITGVLNELKSLVEEDNCGSAPACKRTVLTNGGDGLATADAGAAPGHIVGDRLSARLPVIRGATCSQCRSFAE